MKHTSLLAQISEKPLLGDGAMGTQLQEAGLEPGGCGESWNLEVRTMMGVSPEQAAERMVDLGVDIVGGCCGSTPAHIAKFRFELDTWMARFR